MGFPSLMCSAAKLGDLKTLARLRREGGDYNVEDYDARTPLHIAASEGHALVVEAILTEGAPVHVRDRHGNTPLIDAVRNKNFQCIEMMKNAGGQLKISDHHLANELCTLALFGDLDGITAWHMGGANLDARNYDGRTALHIAVAEKQEEIVRYLVSQGSNPRLEDRLGRTAFSGLPQDSSNLMELLEWGESLQVHASDLTVLPDDN